MARLSARDEARASAVAAAIHDIDERGVDAIDVAVPMFRELLGCSNLVAYGLDATDTGTQVYWGKSIGFGRADHELRASLTTFFDRLNAGRAQFDPRRPQRKQRNRAVMLPKIWLTDDDPADLARRLSPHSSKLGLHGSTVADAAQTTWELGRGLVALGICAISQLRLLLSDGESMLTVIGGCQEHFEERQRLLLQRVALPLRDRLIFERRTGGGLGHAAMVAALEHIPAAAFVLDAAARVTHANAVGRHRLEMQGDAIRLALSQAVAGEPARRPDLVVTRLTGPGMPALYLAVCATRGDRVLCGLERARSRWQLTAREADILAELASGRSNRDIAERLGVAPRTVELHVSSLLRKAHADTRSQLVIDLWHLADFA